MLEASRSISWSASFGAVIRHERGRADERSANLGILLLAVLGSAGVACGDSGQPRDNLLFISLDTTRRDFMGFHGRAPSPTPNLDRLALESIVFEDAYSVAPLTLPAHVSMFTGLYPLRHGVRDNSSFRLSAEATTLAEVLRGVGYHTGAAVASAVLDGDYGLSQGFESYSAPRRVPGEASENYVELPADVMVDQALSRIAALPEPFAFWLHLFDPHAPYLEHAEPGHAAGATLPERYAGEIRFTDAQLGRLLDELRADPRWERLIVVVVADHGEGLLDGREKTHGHFVGDPTMRIPMLIRHPRLPAQRHPGIVSIVDLMPTLLGWLGLSKPDLQGDDGRARFDGVDLAGLLGAEPLSPTLAVPREVALESYYVYWNFGWAPFEALVNRDEKFIRSHSSELFDRRADPLHLWNLFAPEEDRSRSWLERSEARFGMPPDPRLVVQYEVSSEEIEALSALGYAAGSSFGSKQRVDFDALPDAGTKLDVIARITRARQALDRGEVDLALELMQESCETEPMSAYFHFEFASTLLAHRPLRWQEAEAALERAVALDANRADAFNNLGALLTKRWEQLTEEARALQAAGDTQGARELTRAGKEARARAIERFREALVRDPGYVEALANLARLLQVEAEQVLAKGERERARGLYAEVVELLGGFVGSIPEGHARREGVESTYRRCRARLSSLE